LTDRSGHVDAVVTAGRRARVHFGSPVEPQPFVPSASMLEVRTTGPVVPMLRMPDGGVAAGFLAGEVEVNQVFGSLTEGRPGRWLVEVPAGHEGPYTLILTGTGSGAFSAKVTGKYGGFAVYRQELKGDVREGEQMFTRIRHDLSGKDPRTARVLEASFERLQPWAEGEPPAVVAVPGAPARPIN
jgi:hypothetical protein